MKHTAVIAIVLLLATAVVGAQTDDFRREGKPEQRAKKDALEGQLAPAIEAINWINTPGGSPLHLPALKGKVVVLDFWGTW